MSGGGIARQVEVASHRLAENAVRFEHAMDLAKPGIERSPVLHHVDLAHQENEVDRSGVEIQLGRRIVDANNLDLAVGVRRGAKQLVEPSGFEFAPVVRTLRGRAARRLSVVAM